jgi:hypothetical protein
MYRTIAVIIAFLALVTSAEADEPRQNDDVGKLILQLGDKDFQKREAATRAIELLGSDALPALQNAKDYPDLEVRSRIATLIQAAPIAPKRVNLKLTNAPLYSALDELAKQTGYKLEFDRHEEPLRRNCNIKLEKGTFWEALDKVCSEGGLSVSVPGWAPAMRPGEDNKVLIVSSHITAGNICCDSTSPHRIRHGAFAVSATGFDYQRQETRSNHFQKGESENRPATPDLRETLQLQFILVAEPRLKILSTEEPLITRAIDDQGQSLVPKEDATNVMSRRMHGPWDGGIFTNTQTLLVPASKGAHAVKVISGSIPITVEKGIKPIVLSNDLSTAQGRQVSLPKETITITLFFAPPAHDQYKVCMTREKRESDVSDGFDQRDFELQDAKGTPYMCVSSSSGGDEQRDNLELGFVPPFDKAVGPPTKLLYMNRDVLTINVPFEFKDLPLP